MFQKILKKLASFDKVHAFQNCKHLESEWRKLNNTLTFYPHSPKGASACFPTAFQHTAIAHCRCF